MESALIKHNPHWQNNLPELFVRDILPNLIAKLHLKQIHVLKGIRRSGKTTLFKLLIQHLSQQADAKSILYVNLDDPYFSELYQNSKHLYRLLELSEKVTGQAVQYLFLDEVQNVEGWEKFVKAIYDNQSVKKIYVTGSNSSLLASEYAQLLSGRYISDLVTPLSFNEALRLNGINNRLNLFSKKAKVLKLVDELMHFGSFYEVLTEASDKRDIVLSYYETLLLKDCIANNSLRDAKGFQELAHFAISNSTNLFSYNSLAKAIGSNDNTVKEYLRVMEDSYILSEIKAYSYSLKEQLRARKKLYLNDNSFLAQTSFRFSKDQGKLFENLVYVELTKLGYEIYFYNKEFECDFIAKKDNQLYAFQVCYELNAHNLKREIDGLKKLPIDCQEKHLIVYEKPMFPVNDKAINLVTFYEFFSSNS